MERYTFKPELPKIVALTAASFCGDELEQMIDRMVMMHTPTGGIVEILPSRVLLDSEYEEHPFVFTDNKGVSCHYTALLLNGHRMQKAEERKIALNYVVKWFLKYAEEYGMVMSAKPVQYI